MKDKIVEKREKEKQMIKEMISLYCRKNHHSKQLCTDCNELLNYANIRIDKCPFMETKTFCSKCKVHCYKPDMQKKRSYAFFRTKNAFLSSHFSIATSY